MQARSLNSAVHYLTDQIWRIVGADPKSSAPIAIANENSSQVTMGCQHQSVPRCKNRLASTSRQSLCFIDHDRVTLCDHRTRSILWQVDVTRFGQLPPQPQHPSRLATTTTTDELHGCST